MSFQPPRLLACLLGGLLLSAPAAADEVHLKSGRVLQGTVLEQGPKTLRMRTDAGIEVELQAAQVVKVEKGQSPAQEAEAKRAALAKGDLPGHKALARWCDGNKLRRQARELREAILARWPGDVETRKALGHVFHEGAWKTRADYMRSLGLVRSADGRSWISPEEAKAQAQAAEAKEQRKQVEKLLRRSSYQDVAEIEPALKHYPDAAAVPALIEAVDGTSFKTRQLAIRELGRRKAAAAEEALAKAAVEDPKRDARDAALDALMALEPKQAPKYFLRSVTRRKNPFQRVHAVKAVGAFPAPGAVPVLIRALRETTSGFGKASISTVTQRAYIQDFELSSGGTGNVVAEVANPQIGTFSEGTTLEMKVILWERESIVKVLRKLSGQRFGADPGEWQRWWKQQQGE
jgi:hypothetical protein